MKNKYLEYNRKGAVAPTNTTTPFLFLHPFQTDARSFLSKLSYEYPPSRHPLLIHLCPDQPT